MKTTLTYGQVGGSLRAFIGGVHRTAIAFSGRAFLAAGCFSQDAAKNAETGEFYHLDKSRVYPTYQEMAAAEGKRDDGISFVVITTPNNAHYGIAKAFLENGISSVEGVLHVGLVLVVVTCSNCVRIGQVQEILAGNSKQQSSNYQ